MKRCIPFLAASVAVITPTLFFTTPAVGEAKTEGDCPNTQLDQLHAHWHALVTEKDPVNRARMIREHRQLVAQAKQAKTAAAKGEVREDCVVKSGQHHHDLGNMAEMHTMMLDMIER